MAFGKMILSSGALLDFRRPDPDLMTPEVIGHALANECRFGGHTSEFYSVAQHCVFVSYHVPREIAFIGLMHDATEAFCKDMPTPIKDGLAVYKILEAGLWAALVKRYRLPLLLPVEVHAADKLACKVEAKSLISGSSWEEWYPETKVPFDLELSTAWPPGVAKEKFLARYRDLVGPHNLQILRASQAKTV